MITTLCIIIFILVWMLVGIIYALGTGLGNPKDTWISNILLFPLTIVLYVIELVQGR